MYEYVSIYGYSNRILNEYKKRLLVHQSCSPCVRLSFTHMDTVTSHTLANSIPVTPLLTLPPHTGPRQRILYYRHHKVKFRLPTQL